MARRHLFPRRGVAGVAGVGGQVICRFVAAARGGSGRRAKPGRRLFMQWGAVPGALLDLLYWFSSFIETQEYQRL